MKSKIKDFSTNVAHVRLEGLSLDNNNEGEFPTLVSGLLLFCLTVSAAIIPDGSCESRQSYLVIEERDQGKPRAGRQRPPGIFRVQKGSSMMALA